MNNSQLPGDHVSAGSYDTAMRVRTTISIPVYCYISVGSILSVINHRPHSKLAFNLIANYSCRFPKIFFKYALVVFVLLVGLVLSVF